MSRCCVASTICATLPVRPHQPMRSLSSIILLVRPSYSPAAAGPCRRPRTRVRWRELTWWSKKKEDGRISDRPHKIFMVLAPERKESRLGHAVPFISLVDPPGPYSYPYDTWTDEPGRFRPTCKNRASRKRSQKFNFVLTLSRRGERCACSNQTRTLTLSEDGARHTRHLIRSQWPKMVNLVGMDPQPGHPCIFYIEQSA